MKTTPLLAALAATLFVMNSADAQTRLQLTSGLDYSSGEFGGSSRTDVTVASFAARTTHGAWSFRASLPVIAVRGDAATIGQQVFVIVDDNGGSRSGSNSGSGRNRPEDDGTEETESETIVTPITSTRRVTNTGLGDVSLSATYAFNDVLGDNTYLDVTGRVRLPTGDEDKGLSLGVVDYAAIAEVGVDRDGRGVYFSAGRRFLSDADAFEREDGWQAGLGGWLEAGEAATFGAYADWRESSSRRGDDPAEAGAYVTYKITRAVKVSLNASAGLTDASPDYAVGVTLSWRASERGDRK